MRYLFFIAALLAPLAARAQSGCNGGVSTCPAASSVNAGDLLPVVQGSSGPGTGIQRKATVGQLYSGFMQTGNNGSDIANPAQFRVNLGLGSLATLGTAGGVNLTSGPFVNTDPVLFGWGNNAVSFAAIANGAGGATGTINYAAGDPGSPAFYQTLPLSGTGGSSRFGGGAFPASGTSSGNSATSPGAGGSGGSLVASSGTAAAGGCGAGLVVVWEYT